MIVNPAGVGAVWRPPEGSPPHCADNAADHGTNRSGDHQAGPCTGDRADRIRLRNGRSKAMVRNETAANRHLRMVVPRWAKCEIGQDLAFNVANAAGFLSRNVFAEAVAEATH
jgi:hypothetical protein